MQRTLLGLLGAGAVALAVVATAPAATAPPKLAPIRATFDQAAFATVYTASATDADGDTLSMSWTFAAPTQDTGCKDFQVLSPTKAVWHHGDQDGCNHGLMGPRGHKGMVHWFVSDGAWTCTEAYDGTITGTGSRPACFKTVPVQSYACTGGQITLFDDSNGGGVSNGATGPTFTTKGQPYCLVSIRTYHWNDGHGAKPGTLGLSGSSTVGPLPATGSAGQGGAPNVNWQANVASGKTVVLRGTYTCQDSDHATWSQDQQSGGKGFCVVVVTRAVPQGKPAKAKASYRCTGGQLKLFDSSNGGGVSNGATGPTFTTKGQAYCLSQIVTYHWNDAKGATPGTLGLTGSSTAGPFKATGSAGQGGAPNVNWTASVPTTSSPVVLDGTYTCVDSDPATWSQDQQSGGKGFCTVYVTKAVKVAGAASGKKVKPKTTKPAKKKGKTGAAGGKKKSGKLGISASPDTGNPPLAVTFTLSSPKVVQWRVDFGDGKSVVRIGQPPATLAHTYAQRGDYRPRLTILPTPAGPAQSKATSVQVGTALMAFKAQPASGAAPLKVTFTLGTSVQNITTWSVDFGDGQRAAGAGKPPATVSHTYAKDGTYRATFAVKPGQYALVASFAQITVGAGTPPVLSLTASPTSGTHPLHVTFALGTHIPGKIVSWVLQFGDGQRAGGQGTPPATVSHTYAKKGTYGAYLVVAQQQQYGPVQYVVPRGGLAITVG
ncbi:MAG: PKD domain-containing protein [Chloroflexota bacterium]|nr:PKD domain-containing protein [Chloroflexota bacterium]